MPDPSVAIQRVIEIDGRSCADNVLIHLESTIVVDRLAMPDTFTLVFRDPDRNILGDGRTSRSAPRSRSRPPRRATHAPKVLHRRRGHLDRDRVRLARHARRRPRLRPVAPAGRGPQVARRSSNVKYLGHRDPDRAGAAGLTPGRRRVRGHARPRVPGQPVRPRLPVRPRAPDRLRLSASTARTCCSRSPSSRRHGTRPRARPWAPNPTSPRVGRRPARLPRPR